MGHKAETIQCLAAGEKLETHTDFHKNPAALYFIRTILLLRFTHPILHARTWPDFDKSFSIIFRLEIFDLFRECVKFLTLFACILLSFSLTFHTALFSFEWYCKREREMKAPKRRFPFRLFLQILRLVCHV